MKRTFLLLAILSLVSLSCGKGNNTDPLEIIPVTPEPVPETGGEDVPFPEHEGYRVYADNQSGWTQLNLYLYGDVNNLGGNWPGIPSGGSFASGGKDYLYFDIPISAYGCRENLIFNDGTSQIKQEPSITFGTQADYFFTVTATGATAFDGGSQLSVEEPAISTEVVEVASLTGSVHPNYQIYQVNPKLYGSSGAFGKIEARLDEIKALGTDIFYLMPVYAEGRTKSIGSPYCVRDFTGVNTSFGSLEDLRSLVQAAHDKGMKVMFDWVANHTAWDCVWTSEHKDWYAQDASGNIVCPTADGTWSDVAQLDYSNKELWDGMTDALLYWVKELDIDGYRCDYAHGPSGSRSSTFDEFWVYAIGKLRELKPGFIMLAESDFAKMYNDGFDIIFSRSTKSQVVRLIGGGSVADMFKSYVSDLKNVPAGKAKLYFVTNHDDASETNPLTQFRSADGALAAMVLMRSLNGSSMLYGSQEVAHNGTLSFYGSSIFNWSQNPSYLAAYQAVLTALSSVDRSGDVRVWSSGHVAFIRYADGSVIVVNTGGSAAEAQVPEPLQTRVRDLIAGDETRLGKELSLAAYGYAVYRILS